MEIAQVLGAANRAAALLATNFKCANFIVELIWQASRLVRPTTSIIPLDFEPRFGPDGPEASHSADIVIAAYKQAFKNNLITASHASGISGNTITYGETKNHTSIIWNDEFYRASLDDQVLHTIHEALHLFPYFTTTILADAAHMLATRNSTSPGTPANLTRAAASRYLNQEIAANCRR